MRKIHRYGFKRVHHWGRRRYGKRTGLRTETKAACGVILYPGTPDCGRGIDDAAFVNLPAAAQCASCRVIIPKAHHGVGLGHATEEQVVGLETALLAFARLATDMLELRRDPKWRHRCLFDADRRVCACGRRSEVLRVHARLKDAGFSLLGRWLTSGEWALRRLGVFTSSADAGELVSAELAL